MSSVITQSPEQVENKQKANGRRTSIIEGFIQTIGINMGGLYMPNFILTAFLLNIMHASGLLIGFATAIQFLVGLMQPLANFFLPKLKNRRVMVAVTSTLSRLLFVGSIFFGMYFSGPGAEAAFMAILCIGAFSMSFSSVGWSTWMADLVPENGRGGYFALRNSVCAVAGILAFMLGGWLLKQYGETNPGGYAWIYLICAVTSVTGGVLLLFQHEPAMTPHGGGSTLANYRKILADRNFMSFVGTVGYFNFALLFAGPFFTVHFLSVIGISIETMTILTIAAAVTGILGNFFFGKLSDVLGNRFILRFTMLVMIIPTLLALFMPWNQLESVELFGLAVAPAELKLGFVSAIILLQSFVMAGWNLASFNTSLAISPRAARPLYIGIYNSLAALPAIVAPLAGGLISDLYKSHPFPVLGMDFAYTAPVFAVSAVLLLVGLLAFPLFRENNRSEDYSLRDVVLRLDFPEIISKLFLSSFIPRISRRHKLVDDIVELKSPAAVVPLERLLLDMDQRIRLRALEGLGKTGAAEAMEILLDYFPRSGILERFELMKAFAGFTADQRVQRILITETASPYPTLRVRALVSLLEAAATPAVKALVHSRLAPPSPAAQGAPVPAAANAIPPAMVDEEYLAYLDLACLAGQTEAISWSLERYQSLGHLASTQAWRSRYLYAWSQLTACQADFYRWLSADTDEGKEGLLDEARVALMENLSRHPDLREIHPFLKREANEHRYDTQGYLSSIEKALVRLFEHGSRPVAPAVAALLLSLIQDPQRDPTEEIFLLLSLRAMVETKP